MGPNGAEDRTRGGNGDDQAGRRRREERDNDERGGVVAGGQVERCRQGPEAGEGGREPGPNGGVLQIPLVGAELQRQSLRPLRTELPGGRQRRPTGSVDEGKEAEAAANEVHIESNGRTASHRWPWRDCYQAATRGGPEADRPIPRPGCR